MTSAFRGLAASESWANWRKWDRHSDTFVALITLVLALEAPLTTSLIFLGHSYFSTSARTVVIHLAMERPSSDFDCRTRPSAFVRC